MKKVYIELKWAVIFTITILLWMLLEKTMGWYEDKIADYYWLTLIFLPFVILLYLLALREKRRRVYIGKITWLQGFISGTILTIFVTALSPLAQYITNNFLTPEYFNNVIEYSVTNDFITRTRVNNYFNIHSYLWQSSIGTLGIGIIIAAIAAIFVQKK